MLSCPQTYAELAPTNDLSCNPNRYVTWTTVSISIISSSRQLCLSRPHFEPYPIDYMIFEPNWGLWIRTSDFSGLALSGRIRAKRNTSGCCFEKIGNWNWSCCWAAGNWPRIFKSVIRKLSPGLKFPVWTTGKDYVKSSFLWLVHLEDNGDFSKISLKVSLVSRKIKS